MRGTFKSWGLACAAAANLKVSIPVVIRPASQMFRDPDFLFFGLQFWHTLAVKLAWTDHPTEVGPGSLSCCRFRWFFSVVLWFSLGIRPIFCV